MTELEQVREAIANATREMVMSSTTVAQYGEAVEYRVEREKFLVVLKLLVRENQIKCLIAGTCVSLPV